MHDNWFCLTCRENRINVAKSIVFLTDGNPSSRDNVNTIENTIESLHKKRVKIISVGIGSNLDDNWLKKLASDEKYVVHLTDGFEKLDNVLDEIMILTCSVS